MQSPAGTSVIVIISNHVEIRGTEKDAEKEIVTKRQKVTLAKKKINVVPIPTVITIKINSDLITFFF